MLEINLLPVREARRRADAMQQVMQMTLALVVAFGITGIAHTRLVHETGRTEARISQMKKDIDKFKPQLDQVAAFKKKKAQLQKKIDVIDGLDKARKGPVRVMAELADRTPDRLDITTFDTKGGQVALQGQSLDNEVVAHFLRNLSESKYFTDVDLDSTKLMTDRNGLKLVKFDINARLTNVGGPKPEAKEEARGPKRGHKPARRRKS